MASTHLDLAGKLTLGLSPALDKIQDPSNIEVLPGAMIRCRLWAAQKHLAWRGPKGINTTCSSATVRRRATRGAQPCSPSRRSRRRAWPWSTAKRSAAPAPRSSSGCHHSPLSASMSRNAARSPSRSASTYCVTRQRSVTRSNRSQMCVRVHGRILRSILPGRDHRVECSRITGSALITLECT